MWSAETVAVVALTFFIGGFVKGVVGLGLPTISLAALTATLGLHPAMALVLAPSLATNLLQATRGGHGKAVVRRLWPYLLAAALGIWLGVRILVVTDAALLSKLLGVMIVVYSLLSLARFKPCVRPSLEAWIAPPLGVINGVLTGLTGAFVVPSVFYLQALGLERDVLVQAMGIMFLFSTVGMVLALGSQAFITVNLALLSSAAAIPAMGGMVIGQRLSGRLAEAMFKKLLFAALLFLGLYILVR
jgi:uncharacterized membrane protein YfcA